MSIITASVLGAGGRASGRSVQKQGGGVWNLPDYGGRLILFFYGQARCRSLSIRLIRYKAIFI